MGHIVASCKISGQIKDRQLWMDRRPQFMTHMLTWSVKNKSIIDEISKII